MSAAWARSRMHSRSRWSAPKSTQPFSREGSPRPFDRPLKLRGEAEVEAPIQPNTEASNRCPAHIYSRISGKVRWVVRRRGSNPHHRNSRSWAARRARVHLAASAYHARSTLRQSPAGWLNHRHGCPPPPAPRPAHADPPGSREPSATSVPVREWATPPAKARAIVPGPRMPQRTSEAFVISLASPVDPFVTSAAHPRHRTHRPSERVSRR